MAKSRSGPQRDRSRSKDKRGRRPGKYSKRSPFSGIQRDMRAKFQRISQRDRRKSVEDRLRARTVPEATDADFIDPASVDPNAVKPASVDADESEAGEE